jgi:hypothetical protein
VVLLLQRSEPRTHSRTPPPTPGHSHPRLDPCTHAKTPPPMPRTPAPIPETPTPTPESLHPCREPHTHARILPPMSTAPHPCPRHPHPRQAWIPAPTPGHPHPHRELRTTPGAPHPHTFRDCEEEQTRWNRRRCLGDKDSFHFPVYTLPQNCGGIRCEAAFGSALFSCFSSYNEFGNYCDN